MSMAQPKHNEAVKENKEVRPFGMKDKFGYLFGDLGNDFFFFFVGSYLMVYYTDVFGISAAFVGVLFMVARIWDAFADVTWGRFIDTRKTTRNGKFRPWIFRMSFPLVILGISMFIYVPGQSKMFYMVYATITYIIWGTLYSTVNIPYGSMASVMTGNPIERSQLSTWRTVGSMMAQLLLSALVPMLMFVNNKPDATRFFFGAIGFGIIAIICYMACYKLTTERITIPENTQEKMNLKTTMKGLRRNKPLIWILVASLSMMLTQMLIGTVNVYLFKDYFANTLALSIVGMIQAIAVFVLAPFVKPLTAKFGKKEIASAGTSLAALSYLAVYFLQGVNVWVFIGFSALAMLGFGMFNIVVWAFVTDVIDYQELITGVREDGTVYSIYSFARKIGQALAGGVGGFAIGLVGYNATNKIQTQDVLDGIYSLATLVPGVLFTIIALVLIFLYPLNKQRTNQLSIDLANMRNKGNE